MNIIPTLTVMKTKEYEEMIKNFVKAGVTSVRCNATRFENQVYEDSINEIKDIYFKYTSNELELILDIPYPKTKKRITYASKENQISLYKGDVIRITNKDRELRSREIKSNLDLGNVKMNDILIIGDGDCELLVCKKDSEGILGKSLNSGKVGMGKAIYVQEQYCEELTEGLKNNYIQLCKQLKPQKIALSFVEQAGEVEKFRKLLEHNEIDAKIVSKIESCKGVENLNEILEKSEEIMLARGDLALTGGYTKLYQYQQYIVEKTLNAGRKLYVATEILNSLCEKNYPTRSEVCDVARLLEVGVDNFILSGPLCRFDQFNVAVKYLNELFENYG